MKKRFVAFCMVIVTIAFSLTVVGVKKSGTVTDVSYAQRNTYAEGETERPVTTNRVDNFIGDKVESASNVYGMVGDLSNVAGDLGGYFDVTMGSGGLGGIGEAIGGVGDVLGGLLDGSSNNTTQNNAGVTYSVADPYNGHIQVVPAATQSYTTITMGAVTSATQSVSVTASPNVGETVDFAATQNPYQKPTTVLKGGDTGDGVKWMQWMFIYTRYGLKDNGITGVFDEDTMAVVKKLQKENNMTVDGIVNDAVIDKIELLYYEATYTQPTLAVATTAQVKVTSPVVTPEEDNSTVVLLIVVIVLVWVFAITFVVLMFVKNKKKKASAVNKSAETPAEEKADNAVQSQNEQ